MVGFSRKQPNDLRNQSIWRQTHCAFSDRPDHAQQPNRLPRAALYIYLRAPVSEGFPRGIRASRDRDGEDGSPRPRGLTELARKGGCNVYLQLHSGLGLLSFTQLPMVFLDTPNNSARSFTCMPRASYFAMISLLVMVMWYSFLYILRK